MRGSTRKRGSTWTAYWQAPRYDPETGTTAQMQRSKGGFARQKDAQAFLTTILPRVATGTYVEPSSESLAVFLRAWLAAQTNVKPLTANRYRQTIEGQIVPRAIGSIPLRQISPADVLAFLAELERCSDPHCDHRAGDCRGLAPSSRMVICAVLKKALNDAVGWDKLSRSPAARVKTPRVGQTRVTAWSPTELNRFLVHVTGDRLEALWRLGAMTGMRRGELCGLRWQDVDLEARTLRVEQQALPTPGGVTFGSPKSKRSRRTITLDAATVTTLRDHRDRQLAEQALAADLYQHDDLVFPDEIGRVTHPNAISNQFVIRRKGAGIPVGSVHVLRHTHATIALEARCPLHVVAARLGDRPETLLATYAHLLPTSDAAVADAVAAAIIDKPLTEALS